MMKIENNSLNIFSEIQNIANQTIQESKKTSKCSTTKKIFFYALPVIGVISTLAYIYLNSSEDTNNTLSLTVDALNRSEAPDFTNLAFAAFSLYNTTPLPNSNSTQQPEIIEVDESHALNRSEAPDLADFTLTPSSLYNTTPLPNPNSTQQTEAKSDEPNYNELLKGEKEEFEQKLKNLDQEEIEMDVKQEEINQKLKWPNFINMFNPFSSRSIYQERDEIQQQEEEEQRGGEIQQQIYEIQQQMYDNRQRIYKMQQRGGEIQQKRDKIQQQIYEIQQQIYEIQQQRDENLQEIYKIQQQIEEEEQLGGEIQWKDPVGLLQALSRFLQMILSSQR